MEEVRPTGPPPTMTTAGDSGGDIVFVCSACEVNAVRTTCDGRRPTQLLDIYVLIVTIAKMPNWKTCRAFDLRLRT